MTFLLWGSPDRLRRRSRPRAAPPRFGHPWIPLRTRKSCHHYAAEIRSGNAQSFQRYKSAANSLIRAAHWLVEDKNLSFFWRVIHGFFAPNVHPVVITVARFGRLLIIPQTPMPPQPPEPPRPNRRETAGETAARSDTRGCRRDPATNASPDCGPA